MTPGRSRRPPGSRGLRSLWLLWRGDGLAALPRAAFATGAADLRLPAGRMAVISDPAAMRAVLGMPAAQGRKCPAHAAAMAPLLGRDTRPEPAAGPSLSTLILDGETARALPHIRWAGQAALARLETGRPADPVPLDAFCHHLMADVMVRLLMSRPIAPQEAADLRSQLRAWEDAMPRLGFAALLPAVDGRRTTPGPRARDAARALRKSVARLVARHRLARVKGSETPDLLTRILDMTAPGRDQALPKVAVVDLVTRLLLAGTEKPAALLGWALYRLARHPAEQAALAEEAARVLDGPATDPLTVSGLERARDVVRESLRLYPPVPLILRRTTAAVTLAGRAIPEDTAFCLSPWHLHRHRTHWREADEFRTTRWRDPDQAAMRHQAYLPFSTGPQACPGAGLAMAELTLLLALICRDLVLRPVPGPEPRPFSGFTLRARPALMVTMTPRRRSDGS